MAKITPLQFLKYLPENNKFERIWILAKTDFIERYYGTRMGIFWALINPFFQLMVYYFVFTILFAVEIENFALYVFSGLILWMFFSESTTKGLFLLSKYKSIIENINIKKIDLYYSSLISTSLSLSFNLLIYIIFSLFFNVHYNFNVLYAPILLINLGIFILSVQLLLGVIHIYLRDINHLWDMALIILFWASPVFYSKELIMTKLPIIFHINPLAGIFVNLRETLLYGSPPIMHLFIYDLAISIILLLISVFVFKKLSVKAAEIL